MKRRTSFCVAVFSVSAVCVFAGEGIASGTVLCNSPSASCPKAEPQSYLAGTTIEASLKEGTQAVIKSSLGNVECSSSSLGGQSSAESGKPLPVEFSALNYSGCALEGGKKCTTTTIGLPISATIESSGENNGTLAFKAAEVLFNCEAFIHCVYSVPTLEAKGGAPATLSATEVTLTKIGGFLCPKTSKLTATYAVSTPKPVYVEE